MTHRVTVIVGKNFVEPANHVHVLLGKSDFISTYMEHNYSDGSYNYSVSSGVWTDTQIAGVKDSNIIQTLLIEDRIPAIVDRNLAESAQSAFIIHNGVDTLPSIGPDKIVAVIHPDPQEVLSLLGLTQKEFSDGV